MFFFLSSIFFNKKIYLFKSYNNKKLDKVVELVHGGSVINGAYPVYFSRIPPIYMFLLLIGGVGTEVHSKDQLQLLSTPYYKILKESVIDLSLFVI